MMSIENINVTKLKELLEKLIMYKAKMEGFLETAKVAKKEFKEDKKSAKKEGKNVSTEKTRLKSLKQDAKKTKFVLKVTESKINAITTALKAIDNNDFQRLWDVNDIKEMDETLLMIDNRVRGGNTSETTHSTPQQPQQNNYPQQPQQNNYPQQPQQNNYHQQNNYPQQSGYPQQQGSPNSNQQNQSPQRNDQHGSNDPYGNNGQDY